jgi:hypothetical protein
LIAGLALSIFKVIGFAFQDYLTSGNHLYITFCSGWLVALVIITTCIVVYETELQRRYPKT